MPAFITIANPPHYLMKTPPMLAPGIIAFMLGIYDDYNNVPGLGSPAEWSSVTPETLATGPSLQFATMSYAGSANNAPAFQWVVQYPTAPSAVEVHLEGTLDQVNGPWFQLAKSTNAAGDSITVNLGSSRVNAVRTNVISFTGAATIISQVMI